MDECKYIRDKAKDSTVNSNIGYWLMKFVDKVLEKMTSDSFTEVRFW